MNDLPKATWEGEFTIAGITLHCYVLDNGQRIVNAEDIDRLIDGVTAPLEANRDDLDRFARWMHGIDD